MPSTDNILKRIDELLTKVEDDTSENAPLVNEVYQGALTLLRVAHGPGSIQESQLLQAMEAADKAKTYRADALHQYVAPAVVGALKSLRSDVEVGLTGTMTMRGSGEVLGDLLGLEKRRSLMAVSRKRTSQRFWSLRPLRTR